MRLWAVDENNIDTNRGGLDVAIALGLDYGGALPWNKDKEEGYGDICIILHYFRMIEPYKPSPRPLLY